MLVNPNAVKEENGKTTTSEQKNKSNKKIVVSTKLSQSDYLKLQKKIKEHGFLNASAYLNALIKYDNSIALYAELKQIKETMNALVAHIQR